MKTVRELLIQDIETVNREILESSNWDVDDFDSVLQSLQNVTLAAHYSLSEGYVSFLKDAEAGEWAGNVMSLLKAAALIVAWLEWSGAVEVTKQIYRSPGR